MLLTTADAAAELSLSTETVKIYCQRGKLKASKSGRFWRIPRKEISRYQRQRRGPGRPRVK